MKLRNEVYWNYLLIMHNDAIHALDRMCKGVCKPMMFLEVRSV